MHPLETQDAFDSPLPVASAKRVDLAAADLRDGLKRYWLWVSLAFEDIRLRYRGSVLGPFWLTLSTLVMIAAMGVVYAQLFATEYTDYLPYLSVGLVLWQFISGIIIEGCQSFIASQPIIQQVKLPYSVHVYRMVCRNVLVFAHNAVIVVGVMAIFAVPVTARLLLLVPALVAIAFNGVWIGLLFGMASARFRDVPPIVASFVQVIFFVTPVFWSANALRQYRWIIDLNPLFAFVDVARSAVLGVPAAATSWPEVFVVTIVGSTVTFLLFARFRARVAFWV